MIVGLRTSAGTCLMRVFREQGSPCPLCLTTRLLESGFRVDSEPGQVDEQALPGGVLAALEDGVTYPAKVVRLGNDAAVVHDLLPVPGCRRCGDRQTLDLWNVATEQVLSDPLLGIVSGVKQMNASADPARLCDVVTGRVHVPLDEEAVYASGAGTDPEAAGRRQLGEAVERYAAFHPHDARFVQAPGKELPQQKIPIALCNGFTNGQLEGTRYRTVDHGTTLAWTAGVSLRDGSTCWVPAAMVYLRRAWNLTELAFAPLSSTGLACHRSHRQAAQRALLEVFERYWLTAAWYRQDFGVRVDPKVLSDDLAPVLERMARAGLRPVLRALCRAPFPYVVVAAIAGDRYPWVTCGSAARGSLTLAAADALLEAAQLWQGTRGQAGRPSDGLPWYATPHGSRDLLERLQVDEPTDQWDPFDEVPAGDVEQALVDLCPSAVVTTLTTPDLKACGFEVVKLVVPGVPFLAPGPMGRRACTSPD